MIRISLCVLLCLVGCGSDATGDAAVAGAGNAGQLSCPSVAGTWTITEHCEPSLVGMPLAVSERECSLSFAAPFDMFSGQVTAAGALTLSGPQKCSGQANASAIDLTCSPGTCIVKLAR